ncbi:MAG: hypothetical protein ACHP84_15565 [Caulobacterales bacterium]
MEFDTTLALAVISFALAALCGWLGSRPPNPLRGPRLVPYRLLMLVTGAVGLLLTTHLLNLLGVNTGPIRR